MITSWGRTRCKKNKVQRCFIACWVILRPQVHDTITFNSIVHYEPKLGQMIFSISLTMCKNSQVKRVLELEMPRVESMGHGKALAHFGNLVLCTNEVLNEWIDVWPLNQSYRGYQREHLAQRILVIEQKFKELWSLDQKYGIHAN